MAGPSAIDRRQYGDLADDVCLLRSDGRTVARFKGGFRVDSHPEIFNAAQVSGMADNVRARREAVEAAMASRRKPDSPRRPMARHEIERSKPKPVPKTPEESQAAGGDDGLKRSGEGHAVTPFDPPSDKLEPNAGAAGGAEAPAPITRTADDTPPGGGVGTAAASGPGSTSAQTFDEEPGDKVVANVGGRHEAGLKTPVKEVARVAPPVPAARVTSPFPPSHHDRQASDHIGVTSKKVGAYTPSTAGPKQGAAKSRLPPNDAPQAVRIEEPTATPAPAVVASAGTHSDAAPTGRVDVVPNYDVPPSDTPQTEAVAPSSVTPAREEGVAAGTIQKSRGRVEADTPAKGQTGKTTVRCAPAHGLKTARFLHGATGTATGDGCRSGAGVATGPRDTITDSDRIAALEARIDRFERLVRDAVAELVERLDAGWGNGR